MWGIYESNTEQPPLYKRPRNYVTTNFAKYIVDTNASYFIGKPMTYNIPNKALNKEMNYISKMNSEADHNYKIAQDMGIYGYGAEIMYMDEESNIRYRYIPAYQAIFVYSDSDYEKLLFGIRFYLMPTSNTSMECKGELYTDKDIYYFDASGITDIKPHPFGVVPMIQYTNNNNITGDILNVIDILDTYNNMEMITANDFEYFSNAILLLRGYQGTSDEELRKLFRDRILLTDEDGDASWLMKDLPSQALEDYKKRLLDDLQTISNTPILNNLAGGQNVTATAVRFKLIGLEQSATQKERSFKKSLNIRTQGILNVLNLKKNKKYSIEDIMVQFHRNVPENEQEKIEMITKLTGIISEETQLEQVPFVEDVTAEMARKKAERKEMFEESVESGSYSTDDTRGFAADEKSQQDEKVSSKDKEEI